jgi:hypothetical protein
LLIISFLKNPKNIGPDQCLVVCNPSSFNTLFAACVGVVAIILTDFSSHVHLNKGRSCGLITSENTWQTSPFARVMDLSDLKPGHIK